MKNLFFLVLLFTFFESNAQLFYRKSEFGIGAGASNYFGDLNTDIGFKSASYSASFFYKYNVTKYIALKINSAYANIGADDKNSTNFFQQQRNLNFKNNVFEISVGGEFHFFQYKIGDFENRFTPYVSVGAGLFWTDPYTTYEGKNYFLRPLGTEGQKYDEFKDRRYTNKSYSFPIGVGFKYWMAGGITFHMEYLNRFTITDYLDDVSTTYVGADKFIDNIPSPYPSVAEMVQDRSSSLIGVKGRQRGISSTKDQFMTLQVGLSFRLPTYKCPDEL